MNFEQLDTDVACGCVYGTISCLISSVLWLVIIWLIDAIGHLSG